MREFVSKSGPILIGRLGKGNFKMYIASLMGN